MTSGRRYKIALISILALVAVYWLYKYSPRKIEFLGYYEKVGAHRVNDLKKLNKSLSYFDAIELDLVFLPDSNVLDVHHPPFPVSGLTLTEYVLDLRNEQPFIWLDIKNLDESNAAAILELVNQAFETINYPRQKILIETRYPEGLPMFAQKGYKTSFYLPQNLYKLSDRQLSLQIAVIKNVLKQQPETAISSSYVDYETLNSYFPETPKYYWTNGHSAIKDYSLIRTILKDTTVKLVLSSYRTF